MNKYNLLLIAILLLSTLAGCAGSTSLAPANSNAPVDAPAGGDPASGAQVAVQGTPNAGAVQSGELLQQRDLPDSFKLALGTLKLDETDYALVGLRTKQKFRMGDLVKIKVVAANLSKKQLDYEWVISGEFAEEKSTRQKGKKRK
mgnify:CR=1 FL=1